MNQPPNNGWAPLPAPPPVAPAYGYGTPGYYGGAPVLPPLPPPQKPSGGYKALAIIQIVLGALGICYALFGIAAVVLFKSWSATSSVYDWPTVAYSVGHSGMAIITGAMLIATGIGIWKAKKWSRVAGIAYAIVSLGETVLGTAINFLIIQPSMHARMGTPSIPEIEMITIVSAAFGILVASVLPIVTLVALVRKGAKDQLDL
jgi:hypothetical protein